MNLSWKKLEEGGSKLRTPKRRLVFKMRLLQFVYCAAAARALQLPTTWGSSMVLEANAPNKLWGLDASGSTVSVTAFGRTYNATADSSGAWSVLIAAQPKSTLPSTISIASTSGGAATLSDVLVGYTVVCSGQSNMELNVGATYNYVTETADADALGATLRIFQVAMLDAYAGATTPQTNLSASIPWTRASSASVSSFSALCYFFGAELVKKHPDTPIGLLASSWGGTAIQPWMSPAALNSCKGAAPAPTHEELAASADPGLATVGRLALLSRGGSKDAFPTNGSCLYNSMIFPLMQNPRRMLGWYQGVRLLPKRAHLHALPYPPPPPEPLPCRSPTLEIPWGISASSPP